MLPIKDFTHMVRKFLNDFPNLNELRGVPEYSDQDLALCAIMALDDYNITPPVFQPVRFESHPSDSLLVLGTVVYCMMQKGILQFRNKLSYSSGGTSVGIWDKGPAYIGNAQFFGQMWEQKKVALKRSINVSKGFGVIRSSEFNIYTLMTYFGSEYTTPIGVAIEDPTIGIGVALSPLLALTETQDRGKPKTKTDTIPFGIQDWQVGIVDPTLFEFAFYHNLGIRNVGYILDNQETGDDLSQIIRVNRADAKHIVLRVTSNPDMRVAGTVQCFIP